MTSIERIQLDKVCEELERVGWERLEVEELEGVIRGDVFREKIKELNKAEFERYGEDKILPQIFSALESADEVKILDYLRYGVTIFIRQWNATIPVTIKLFDFENPDKNSFHYVREQSFTFANLVIRPDITLFINGIPIVVIEGKSPVLPEVEPYLEGLNQIMRYQKENPELFKFVQFGISTDGYRYPYIPTLPRKEITTPKDFSFWKKDEKEDIFYLLAPRNLLDYIGYFIFFIKDKKGERKKILARYMQYYAAKRVMGRISKYLSKEDEKRNGLIWHWQGSGKTYLMFLIGNLFLHRYQDRNPLVFMVIDRLELQEQLTDAMKSIENKRLGDVRVVERIEELKEIIKNADREWGLKIVTIQKFQPKEIELKKTVKKREVLFLIDEAHRSQYGDLAATMRKIFQNAMFIGFTGTPVFRKYRNTFSHFAYPPEEPYLDVYFIQDSQKDGFTLPLIYRLIEERYVDVLLSERDIRDIIDNYEEDEELTEKVILGEISDIKTKLRKNINKQIIFLSGEKRIRRVIEYIRSCIDQDTENFRFKAMIVATNRKACVIYKRILDEFYPEEFSEVVMSYQANERDEEIHSFKQRIAKKYDSDWSKANSIIKEKFIKEENPKVLIVTDMLLTGFDAPILKVMYLDKVLHYHRLLQAIARVNRPYNELEKTCGLIVDSVGLFKHLQKTINIYNYLARENTEEIRKDLKNAFKDSKENLKVLSKNISSIRTKLKELYDMDIDWIKDNLRSDPEVIPYIKEKVGLISLLFGRDDNATKLIAIIKDTLNIYRGLGADPNKLDYKDDIEILSIIYQEFWRKIKGEVKKGLRKELWDAIIDWIHKSMIVGDMEEKFRKEISPTIMTKPAVYDILSTDFYNIHSIVRERLANPLYKEIFDRLERIKKEWITRNIGVEEFLKELKELDKAVKGYMRIEQEEPWKRVTEFTKVYLKDKAGIEMDLKPMEHQLRTIFTRRRFLDVDRKRLNLEIAKLLVKTQIPYKERLKLEREIMNLIEEEVRKGLWITS